MVLIPEVMGKLNEYYLTGDHNKLCEAQLLIAREQENPQLQEGSTTLSLTSAEIETRVAESGGLKLPGSSPATFKWVEGKLLRVFASDQPEGSCMIMRVLHCDSENLILGVPGAG